MEFLRQQECLTEHKVHEPKSKRGQQGGDVASSCLGEDGAGVEGDDVDCNIVSCRAFEGIPGAEMPYCRTFAEQS